jgi:UDP-glucose 4-epimerase
LGLTLHDFAAVLRNQIPGADIEIGPGANFLGMPYPPHGIYDVARARNELGFNPEYDLDHGIADYLASLERMRRNEQRA